MPRKKIRLNVPTNGGLPQRRAPEAGDIAVIRGEGYEVEAFDGRYVYTRIGQFRYTHPDLEGFVSATVTTADAEVEEKKIEEVGNHEPVSDK